LVNGTGLFTFIQVLSASIVYTLLDNVITVHRDSLK